MKRLEPVQVFLAAPGERTRLPAVQNRRYFVRDTNVAGHDFVALKILGIQSKKYTIQQFSNHIFITKQHN